MSDPFFAQSTLVILCDILDPVSGEAYNRDPRGTAKKAEAYLKASGIGDTVFVRPRAGILRLRRREVQG
jgi:glutamine synthetase